ncbi:hypothetical protein [Sphingobium chungbukense]|nr:hypothetical protein [Sphingobium chungbukense]
MTKLWDEIGEACYRAFAAKEKMLHWRINRAALYSLMADERAKQIDARGISFEDRPLYGIPIKVDEYDLRSAPVFELVTLESLDRRNEKARDQH